MVWLTYITGIRHPTLVNKCPVYDIKQSVGKTPAILELWEMRSTPSLPSLTGSFWPGRVAADRRLSMGQIELFDI